MRRDALRIAATAVLGCLCLAAVAGEESAPARDTAGFNYPNPTGKFKVGTAYLFLKDKDRPDTYTEDPDDHRWISVKAWYPAEPPAGATPEPYGADEFNESMVETGVFRHEYRTEVALRPSASYLDAPFASKGAPFPILIHSSSGVMAANVFLFEELASHGYAVFAVGHPYWCEYYFDAEGGLFYFDKSNRYYVKMWEEEKSEPVIETKEKITRATSAEEKRTRFRELNRLMPTEVADLALWQGDVEFLIDRLVVMNKEEESYRGRLDTKRIGVMGYSKGGALAGQVCATSGRVRAGINLGGFIFGGAVENDLSKPFMTITHVEPWCLECPPINLPFFARSSSDSYLLDIEGANHATFTDLPLLRAYIVPEGILSPLDGERSATIIRSYVLAFFDTHVKGLPRSPLLDEVPSRFDEVRFKTKRTPL